MAFDYETEKQSLAFRESVLSYYSKQHSCIALVIEADKKFDKELAKSHSDARKNVLYDDKPSDGWGHGNFGELVDKLKLEEVNFKIEFIQQGLRKTFVGNDHSEYAEIYALKEMMTTHELQTLKRAKDQRPVLKRTGEKGLDDYIDYLAGERGFEKERAIKILSAREVALPSAVYAPDGRDSQPLSAMKTAAKA